MKPVLSALAVLLSLGGCSVLPPTTLSGAASPNAFDCSINAIADAGYVVEDLEAGMFIRAVQRNDILTVTVTADRLNVVATGRTAQPSRRAQRDAENVLAACTRPGMG